MATRGCLRGYPCCPLPSLCLPSTCAGLYWAGQAPVRGWRGGLEVQRAHACLHRARDGSGPSPRSRAAPPMARRSPVRTPLRSLGSPPARAHWRCAVAGGRRLLCLRYLLSVCKARVRVHLGLLLGGRLLLLGLRRRLLLLLLRLGIRWRQCGCSLSALHRGAGEAPPSRVPAVQIEKQGVFFSEFYFYHFCRFVGCC